MDESKGGGEVSSSKWDFTESLVPRPENEIQAKTWRIDLNQIKQGWLYVSLFPLSSHPSIDLLSIDRVAILSHISPSLHTHHSIAHDFIFSSQTSPHRPPLTSSHNINHTELLYNKLFLPCAILLGFRWNCLQNGGKRRKGYQWCFICPLIIGCISPHPHNISLVFLVVGYFNIILPSSLSSLSSLGLETSQVFQSTFWQCAQSKEHLTSKMLLNQILIMSEGRG